MKNKIQYLIILLILVSPILSIGQNRIISGKVVSFKQFPLSNLTVTSKKAKTEAVTDANGHFKIEVKRKDVISIKETVFEDYSNRISNKEDNLKINLIIKTDEESISHAISSGYISRQDLKYGMENLWQYNNLYSQFTDTYDAIKYALPESRIIVENGRKGVQLRGTKTIMGSNSALIIIDGVMTDDASTIIPADITSIKKLTSAQAAIYGARAGNGIIVIDTK